MVRYDYDRYDYTDRYERDRFESDRLERMIDDARREIDREPRGRDERDDPITRVINDPSITLSVLEKKAINDPKLIRDARGMIVKASSMKRRDQVAGRSPLYPPIKTKRTRKKTKMDRTMSKCLKMANAKLRNKNGKLKKGKTMSDVMKMAHRLCRRHG